MKWIWASGHSSHVFMKSVMGSIAYKAKSASTEVLLQQILLHLLVLLNAMAEFHFGHCIRWEHTNGSNLAWWVATHPHLHHCDTQKHHKRELKECLATRKKHGWRISHVKFEPFHSPWSTHTQKFPHASLLKLLAQGKSGCYSEGRWKVE